MANNSLDVANIFADEHTLATHISSLWSEWWMALAGERALRQEINSFLFATDTKTTSNNSSEFAHSTHRPKLSQIKDNLVANYKEGVMPGQHWMRFIGDDADSSADKTRRTVEAYLQTKHRQMNFEELVDEWLDDWVGAPGNCFAGVTYVHETFEDEDGKASVGYSGPMPYRIDAEDIAFNPTARTFESAPKIVRTIKTLGEIKRDIVEKPELEYSAEIFEHIADLRLKMTSWSAEDWAKFKDLPDYGFGSVSQYFKSGYVEILEYYGDIYDLETGEFIKNAVITVVDRKYVLRKCAVKTWSGKPHIFACGWRRRPNNLWAMSPMANLVGLQYRINHLENTRADAFDKIAQPERVEVGMVENDQDEDGTKVWYAPDGGDVKYIHPPTAALNADLQITSLERAMEEYVGAPSEAMGIRSPGEKTKFEVQTLDTRSGRIFQSKLVTFERFLAKIINASLEVAVRNLNTTDIIRIEDDDFGVEEFRQINRRDISAKGKLVPTGSRHFSRQAQLAQDLAQFMNITAADPEVQNHFPSAKIAQVLEELLGFDKFQMYEPYGRIAERTEQQRATSAADEILIEEEATQRALDDGV